MCEWLPQPDHVPVLELPTAILSGQRRERERDGKQDKEKSEEWEMRKTVMKGNEEGVRGEEKDTEDKMKGRETAR